MPDIVTAGSVQPPHVQAPQVRAPHVVVFRPNDVHTDTRGKKIALSLARAGYRVTMVAWAVDGVEREYRLGECRVVCVPNPFQVRTGDTARRRSRRVWRPRLVGYRSPVDANLSRLRLVARQRELLAGHRLRRVYLKSRLLVVKLRTVAQNLLNRVVGRAWTVYDRRISRLRWGARWRRLLPEVSDYELVFGRRLRQLAPDVIHAHDPKVLGVALRAAWALGSGGRGVRVVYDARENFAGLPEREQGSARLHQALVNHEAGFVRRVDAVLTVSEPISEVLHRRYRLVRPPAVVLNVPVATQPPTTQPPATEGPGIRERLELPEDAPLLVYSGGLSHARGVDVIIRGLAGLPGVHLAIVAVPYPHPMTPGLVELAERVGVADRLHILPPVGTEQLLRFLASATVGVHPMPGGSPNHDMALPNKLFEYLHAGLPLVVADAKEMARFVRDNGIGEVFGTGDSEDYVRAVRAVLENRAAYLDPGRRAELVARYSWQGQEPVLWAAYEQLLGAPRPVTGVPNQFPSLTAVPVPEEDAGSEGTGTQKACAQKKQLTEDMSVG